MTIIPRVIPCLLLDGGRLVKTRRFTAPRYVGDPINTVKLFNDKEVDELAVLDIAATRENRGPDLGLIEQISSQCFMPLCVGGGIGEIRQAMDILGVGVEKVLLNTHACARPGLVGDLAARVGSSSVVVGIDTRPARGGWEVVVHNASRGTGRDAVAWAREVADRGAGEILLTAVHRDGTMEGYDLELIHAVASSVPVPVVACGGAGTTAHLAQAVQAGAAAVAAGSMFVFHGRHRAVLVNVPSRDRLIEAFRAGAPSAREAARHPRTICTRCVMDVSDPDIEFDAAGVCNHCRAYDTRRARLIWSPEERRRRLDDLLAAVRAAGRGRDYDCVIGLSGGVDSTYGAWVIRHELGLRPLAVHFDNGWDSETAVHNIEQTLSRLDIDLYTHVVDWEEFRDLQLSFLRASVINVEIPTDHGIIALLYEAAARHGIRYILTGQNEATESILPAAWVYHNKDLRHLRAVHRRFGSRPLRTMPQLSLLRYAWYTRVRRIRSIPFLNYVPYHKAQAKELLSRELGWKDYGGKHHESLFTAFYQAYLLPVKFGVDKRRAHLASLIVAGQLSRSDGLAELATPIAPPEEIAALVEFVRRKFGVSDEEFRTILDRPRVPHTAFPNNEALFRLLFRLRGLV